MVCCPAAFIIAIWRCLRKHSFGLRGDVPDVLGEHDYEFELGGVKFVVIAPENGGEGEDGAGASLERVKELVAKADTDGNGTVSREEYLEALNNDIIPEGWRATLTSGRGSISLLRRSVSIAMQWAFWD